MQNVLWFSMLMKDEKFTNALIDRYWELRETLLDPDYLCAYIDETASFLGDAAERNYARWGDVFALEEPLLTRRTGDTQLCGGACPDEGLSAPARRVDG